MGKEEQIVILLRCYAWRMWRRASVVHIYSKKAALIWVVLMFVYFKIYCDLNLAIKQQFEDENLQNNEPDRSLEGKNFAWKNNLV
jgi:hypothetical protein